MHIDRREIEETIAELKRTGEYGALAADWTDQEDLDLVRALPWVLGEASDAEADSEFASATPAPVVSDDQIVEEVARAMRAPASIPRGR